MRKIGTVVILFVGLVACQTGISDADAAKVYYNLGNAYFELEEYTLAVTAYQNALTLQPGLITASYNLCRVYLETGRIQEGMAILDELLKSDPENAVLKETLAWVHHLSGDDEKALSVYNEILQRDSVSESALYNSGYLLSATGELLSAIEAYERLYELNPGYPELTVQLAELHYQNDNWERSEFLLLTRLESEGSDKDALRSLANKYFDKELHGRALEILEDLLLLDQEDAEALFLKSVIYLTVADEPEEGLQLLQQAGEVGYRDRERISALLENENLLLADDVKALLDSLDLIPETVPPEESEDEAPPSTDG